MRNTLIILLVTLMPGWSISQEITAPEQPSTGPGGSEYAHASVTQHDYAQEPDGFWLYEPADPKPKSANVIVFIHGYGAYNPMIYGKWIKHLVQKGNTVIYPRYQRNLFSPSPKHFAENVVEAIHNALDTLRQDNHVAPITDHFSLVGHSYGGVLSANLAVYYKRYSIPKPEALMLVSPGTGPFKGGLLNDYNDIPEDTNLIVMVSDRDHTVGDKIGKRIFNTAIKVENRNLIRQYSDYHGTTRLTSGHDESYSIDKDFDTGVRNFTAKRALKISRLNTIDYLGYWKIFDALNNYTRYGTDKEYVFGNTKQQQSLGYWSDGTEVRPLEITLPKPEKVYIKKED